MLQEKDTVSLDMRISFIVWTIISISSKYVTIRIFIPLSTDTGTFSNFVGAGPTSNISRAIPKGSLTMKTEQSSLMADAVELKNKRLSYSACTCNLPLAVIQGGKTNFPFWNADMKWTGILSILSSQQVDFPHLFSKRGKYCSKTPQTDTLFTVWLFLHHALYLGLY